MKKYTYILGFVSAIVMILLTSGSRMDKSEIKISDDKKELLMLSSRVDVVNFISNDDLYEGEMDDESTIIYPNEPVKPKKVKSHFSVSEFTRYDQDASDSTIYKITNFHIPQLDETRNVIGKPIVIRSAARSLQHELSMGRTGKSQHVYKSRKGAVDVSVDDYNTLLLNQLENALMDETEYTRIARYPSFIHVDFAKNKYGKRGYYKNTKYGWIYIGEIK